MRPTSQLVTSFLGFALLLAGCNKAPATDSSTLPHYDLSAKSNDKYLTDFAAKPGTIKTQDGLEYRVIKAGTGKAPQSGADMVTVRYKGMLINGKVFDDNHGNPATFPAGALIPGWIEALSLMKEGDHWELAIPSGLGYGPQGAGSDIPPDQTLVFDMTLIKVTPAQ
jgi:FKBP-type peptidyl-prolyl cis-trans isomerase